jgi:hypothetical protein
VITITVTIRTSATPLHSVFRRIPGCAAAVAMGSRKEEAPLIQRAGGEVQGTSLAEVCEKAPIYI